MRRKLLHHRSSDEAIVERGREARASRVATAVFLSLDHYVPVRIRKEPQFRMKLIIALVPKGPAFKSLMTRSGQGA